MQVLHRHVCVHIFLPDSRGERDPGPGPQHDVQPVLWGPGDGVRAAHALEDRVLSRPGGHCLGPFYMQVTDNVSPWGHPCSGPWLGSQTVTSRVSVPEATCGHSPRPREPRREPVVSGVASILCLCQPPATCEKAAASWGTCLCLLLGYDPVCHLPARPAACFSWCVCHGQVWPANGSHPSGHAELAVPWDVVWLESGVAVVTPWWPLS